MTRNTRTIASAVTGLALAGSLLVAGAPADAAGRTNTTDGRTKTAVLAAEDGRTLTGMARRTPANEGSNHIKSVKYLLSYKGGKVTVVQPNRFIPDRSTAISAPPGHIAYAWNGYRGYWCADAKGSPFRLPKPDRAWTVKKVTKDTKRLYGC